MEELASRLPRITSGVLGSSSRSLPRLQSSAAEPPPPAIDWAISAAELLPAVVIVPLTLRSIEEELLSPDEAEDPRIKRKSSAVLMPTKPPPPSMDAYSRHADGRAAEGRRYPPTVLASDVERLAAGSIALRRHKKATRHAATGLDDWHRAEIAGALRQRLGADGA